MSLPESVLPPLAADAVSSTAQALDEFPVGPPYSPGHLKQVLSEKSPRTFDDLIQVLGNSGSSSLAFVASLVVVGDLPVDGVLTNDAETKLVVLGQVRCRAMDTSGWVTILGGLAVEHALHGRYNDDSVEVMGPLTAGLIVSNDHLIYGKPKTAERKPSQGAAWGPEVFDARWAAHATELASLLVDGIVDAEGTVDVAKLMAARPPWK
ncbi:hypothetical protein LZ198_25205 [Myxococcus sp. K15C18031901]|uniref:hypothetical protein n=1 Tax=Myxococcus dinghuensis TaxID=2906761 RepID=UPI0020A7FE0B|nr:hypothetical protein [Myxococcus dinghuensis]MCP3102171.1 hypothetical protein [Myxococcus dinghuensis]